MTGGVGGKRVRRAADRPRRVRSLTTAVLALLVLLTTVACAPDPEGGPPGACARVITIAHRGNAGVHEDTLEGFRRAVATHADMIETDVWPTADGRLVIIHDGTWNRTTTADGAVSATPLRAVRKIVTLGGDPIPTLDEAVAMSVRNDIPMLIEVKTAMDWGRIGTAIRRHQGERLVTIYSGNPKLIRALRRAAPQVSTGLRPPATMPVAQVAALGRTVMLTPSQADPKRVERFHDRHMKVFVRKPAASVWQRLVNAEVDGFLLDDTPAFDRWCDAR